MAFGSRSHGLSRVWIAGSAESDSAGVRLGSPLRPMVRCLCGGCLGRFKRHQVAVGVTTERHHDM